MGSSERKTTISSMCRVKNAAFEHDPWSTNKFVSFFICIDGLPVSCQEQNDGPGPNMIGSCFFPLDRFPCTG